MVRYVLVPFGRQFMQLAVMPRTLTKTMIVMDETVIKVDVNDNHGAALIHRRRMTFLRFSVS